MMTKKQLLTAPALPTPCNANATPFNANGTPCVTSTSSTLVERLAATSAVRRLADLYSHLLEETVSPRRTLHLVHAQVAALALFFPIDMPASARLLCLAWFGIACLQCKAH